MRRSCSAWISSKAAAARAGFGAARRSPCCARAVSRAASRSASCATSSWEAATAPAPATRPPAYPVASASTTATASTVVFPVMSAPPVTAAAVAPEPPAAAPASSRSPAIGATAASHASRPPPRERSSRSIDSPRRTRVRTVSTGTPMRSATTRGGASSKKRSSTVERYGSARASTATTRRLWISASATTSAAERTDSSRLAARSRATRRPFARAEFSTCVRTTRASHARADSASRGGARSAVSQVRCSTSSTDASSWTIDRASRRTQSRWVSSVATGTWASAALIASSVETPAAGDSVPRRVRASASSPFGLRAPRTDDEPRALRFPPLVVRSPGFSRAVAVALR